MAKVKYRIREFKPTQNLLSPLWPLGIPKGDACYRRDARTVATADMLTAEKIKWSLSASVGRKLAFPFGPPS